jgi:hypothetical protein
VLVVVVVLPAVRVGLAPLVVASTAEAPAALRHSAPPATQTQAAGVRGLTTAASRSQSLPSLTERIPPRADRRSNGVHSGRPADPSPGDWPGRAASANGAQPKSPPYRLSA